MAIAAPTTTSDRSIESSIGRAAALGGVLGFLGVTGLVWLMGVYSGAEALPALGLGAFVGSWGGLGFGAMLAASVAGGRSL